MFETDAEFADGLGGLDKGAADIMVADNAEFRGNIGGLRIAERGRHAGIGNGDHNIDING